MALVTSQAAQLLAHTPPTVAPGWAPGVNQGCAGSICCSVPTGAIRTGSTHPSERFISPDDIPGGSSGTCGVQLVWSKGGVTTGE